MAKFNFRLQSYLDLKSKMEDQRKLEYGKAMSELTRQIQEQERLFNEKNSAVNKNRKSVSGNINPYEINNINNYINLLKIKIEEQKKIIIKAEKEVEKRRLSLVEAVRERKALEILKDKRMEEFINEEKLSEQKFMDEIVSFRGSR